MNRYPIPFLNTFSEPTLLLDEAKCRQNIQFMAEKASKLGLLLRPHFKTHQSHTVGRWFQEAGIKKATVSSLRMAAYFAEGGWSDITVAFPVNILELDTINQLAKKIQLNIVAENLEALKVLEQDLQYPLKVFIKADTGYHRTGLQFRDKRLLEEMLTFMGNSRKLSFTGFLAHAGHSYKSRSLEEIREVHESSMALARELKAAYQSKYPKLVLSVGDTPTCSRMENFEGADEIRPGNFVFYDLTQAAIGSCQPEQIAVAMACPVVAKHADRGEVVVYGGGVHLSKDRLQLANGQTIFGQIVYWSKNGWELPEKPNYVTSLSQEHGIIKADTRLFDQVKIGELIGILPVHSCMAADLMKRYVTLSGEWIEMMSKY